MTSNCESRAVLAIFFASRATASNRRGRQSVLLFARDGKSDGVKRRAIASNEYDSMLGADCENGEWRRVDRDRE
jgi:hypothetical protein